jgi:hypothetical protein
MLLYVKVTESTDESALFKIFILVTASVMHVKIV